MQEKIQSKQYYFPYHYLSAVTKTTFIQHCHQLDGYVYLSYLNAVIELVKEQIFTSLIDVGSGDGRLINELSLVMKDKKLVGVDYDDTPIRLSKHYQDLFSIHQSSSLNNQVSFERLDILTKNKYQHQTDVVTCIEVLEHISLEKVDAFIAGIHRLLKPDGLLILTVPSTNLPVSRKHYQHFTLGLLQEILEKNNLFKIEKFFFLNKKLTLFAKIVRKMLFNSLYIVVQKKILHLFYVHYQKHYLLTQREKKAERIMIVAKKRD